MGIPKIQIDTETQNKIPLIYRVQSFPEKSNRSLPYRIFRIFWENSEWYQFYKKNLLFKLNYFSKKLILQNIDIEWKVKKSAYVTREHLEGLLSLNMILRKQKQSEKLGIFLKQMNILVPKFT